MQGSFLKDKISLDLRGTPYLTFKDHIMPFKAQFSILEKFNLYVKKF